MGLVYQAVGELNRSFPRVAELSSRAIELAERHGWTEETTAGLGYMARGSALAWQGRPAEAVPWVERAERTVRPGASPVTAMGVQYLRGQVELGCGRPADALAAFRAAERLAGELVAPHPLAKPMRAWRVHALASLGETEQAEQVLADLSERARDRGEMRISAAVLRLAGHDPYGATAALAPVLAGSVRVGWRSWLVEAFLLEAIARDALGDPDAAGRAIERALDLAKPDGALMWFLLHPAPDLLRRHARPGTAHAALIAEIVGLLVSNGPAPIPVGRRSPLEPLSKSEIRVLRYLPTHLSAPEIAGELYVSPTTVKTHMRNLYAKLGAHSRAEAVEAARALGLLAPSARSPAPG
jgi:LuxR family transcriptional regulator, maltose regulon positive regulatory protein